MDPSFKGPSPSVPATGEIGDRQNTSALTSSRGQMRGGDSNISSCEQAIVLTDCSDVDTQYICPQTASSTYLLKHQASSIFVASQPMLKSS